MTNLPFYFARSCVHTSVTLMATGAELLDGSSKKKQSFTNEISQGFEEYLEFYQWCEIYYDFDGEQISIPANCEACDTDKSSTDEDSCDDLDKGKINV